MEISDALARARPPEAQHLRCVVASQRDRQSLVRPPMDPRTTANRKITLVTTEADMKRVSLARLFPLLAPALLVVACSSGQTSSTSSSAVAPLM